MTVFDPAVYSLHLAQARRQRGGVLGWGSRNPRAVKALQERLSALGYATEVDGQWGAETEKQFRAFQHATGLKTDGKLGPKSLEQLLKSKPKDRNAADPGLDAIQKVVAPGASQPSRRADGLGQLRAEQRGGGRAAPSASNRGGGRRPRRSRSGTPEGPHGGAIDPATGAETATARTGPIGSTDPSKARTPRAKPVATASGARPKQNNNPEFNAKHPREGGRFAAKQGDDGDDVANAQAALNKVNPKAKQLKTDGQFGNQTAARVRAYQRNNGLKADGIVGPKTSASLRRNLRSIPKPVPKRAPGFRRK